MTRYLLVGFGGFLGAIVRYLVATWAARRFGLTFPWGTFAVNISGSFILGFFATLSARLGWADGWRLFVAVGFVGAYTTFSTFEWETLGLLADAKRVGAAALNIVGSVAAGLLAAFLGAALARVLGTLYAPSSNA